MLAKKMNALMISVLLTIMLFSCFVFCEDPIIIEKSQDDSSHSKNLLTDSSFHTPHSDEEIIIRDCNDEPCDEWG